ncbi:unnamed protein product [Amoebophrya sp. A25]|nr:unnamed protein product [Amoebophrya sp. A25]|eukprot:GSA25T00019376001.1
MDDHQREHVKRSSREKWEQHRQIWREHEMHAEQKECTFKPKTRTGSYTTTVAKVEHGGAKHRSCSPGGSDSWPSADRGFGSPKIG